LAWSSRGEVKQAAALYEQALAIDPALAEVRLGLADALHQLGRDQQAIEQYRAALAARPEWAQAANELSWLLATTGDPALRDPAEALRLAERAAEASGRRDPAILDTLSVCQAAVGRTDNARETLAEALALAEAAGNTALAADLRTRLK
jgi:Tfp pilus assembly protein PilF